MALVLKDRVLETCTAPGTGAVTLLGATAGYQTFSAAIGNANTTYYTIADQSGSNWEVGIGTYSTSGNTLARTTVLSSSNGGSLVNFNAGTQNVFVTYPAEEAIYNNGTSIVGPTGSSVPVENGGTGATTLAANGVVYGNGTSAVGVTAVGSTGQVLVGNTGAAPSWATVSSTLVSSFSAGTTGLTPSTATTGAVTLAGTLATPNGGTGLTSFTANSAVYATSTSALTTGTLPVNAGGTGLTNLTATYIPYGNGTSAFGSSANLTYASSTLTAPVVSASNGLVLNATTLAASFSIPTGYSASSVGGTSGFTVPSGMSVTVAAGSRWIVS